MSHYFPKLFGKFKWKFKDLKKYFQLRNKIILDLKLSKSRDSNCSGLFV